MPPALSLRALCLPVLTSLLLGGCAGGAVGGLANAALQMVGLAKPPPEVPDAQKPPRTVRLQLHAGQRLNTDAKGQSLALVARIYKLRQRTAFEQAPYDSFLDEQKEKALLGADLLEVKEVLLVPGQRLDMQETLSREAAFIGVVALFRAPAAQRWRTISSAQEAASDGIAIGLHACSISSASIGNGALPRCD